MHYLDTNILVYAIVNQDENKLRASQDLIRSLLLNNELLISPLCLQELSFTLSKLKVANDIITKSFNFFNHFCRLSITKTVLNKSFQLVQKVGNGRHINDAIHVVLASDSCKQLSTFDKGFSGFQAFSDISINIL